MDMSLKDGPSPFKRNWKFMLAHMPAVCKVLYALPMGIFLDVNEAEPKQDMEEATDLVLELSGGTMAVRVRRHRYWNSDYIGDWSIRYECHGHKTEIHKLREGFGDWYFYGYSLDDKGEVAQWHLIDLAKVRSCGLLDEEWDVHPNNDGTAGMYIPIKELYRRDCIIASSTTVPL